MRTIFVTGSSGFLGQHLTKALRKIDGVDVVNPSSKECNLLSEHSLHNFDHKKFDHILHLAAWTQAGDFCLKYPGEQWLNNQMINTNILKWWCNNQSQAKLIFMGTSCSYPEFETHIESNYLKGEPTESLYTYAMTKRMLLVGAKALSNQYGLEFCSFVPSTLYGPNYHTDGRQMHFIFDLVRKIVDAVHGGPIPVLWGDGSQVRDIVHVYDFVDIALSLIPRLSNEIVNVGGYSSATIRQFSERISGLCGYNHELIKYDTSRYVGAKSKVLSNEKLFTLLPLMKPRKLDDGLIELIEWYNNTR